MVAAAASSSSSCIQFQLGVQIIFITFFTKPCWHSLFVIGGAFWWHELVFKREENCCWCSCGGGDDDGFRVSHDDGGGGPKNICRWWGLDDCLRRMGIRELWIVLCRWVWTQCLRRVGKKRIENDIMLVVWTKESIDAWEEWEDERIDSPPHLHPCDWASWQTPLQQFDVMQHGCIVATGGAQPSCLLSGVSSM